MVCGDLEPSKKNRAAPGIVDPESNRPRAVQPEYINGDDLEARLDFERLIPAMERVFLGSSDASPRVHQETGSGLFLMMPAWEPSAYVGTKLVTIRLENRATGLDTIHGVYVLFSEESGQPLAILDGRVLTLRRTAATSAAATKWLAREDAHSHLMIGAGALAPYLIRATGEVRPVSRVGIWNRTPRNAAKLVEELASEGIQAEVVSDLQSATEEADIISTATQSKAALIMGANLKSGVHLDLVGSYTPDMVEADPTALARARVFVDTWEGAKSEAGDLIQAVRSGAFDWDHVAGDLRALFRGEVSGRTSPEDITAFKSVGASIEDLAAAALAWESRGTP
ncbi:MAG: ornithine cyclodeaminase family protein [Rhodothermales bacterium]|nr:ornithine cyclodeaminase family protein [Rhodothermales bacterium]